MGEWDENEQMNDKYMFVWFRDIDGVLSRANATEFGLASGVFTRDINKVYSLCELSRPNMTFPFK